MEAQSFSEFKQQVFSKGKGERNFRVKNSWGVYDALKLARKNKWYNIGRPVKEKEFYAIIRGVNDRLADGLAKGDTVEFPHRMGKLELRKSKRGVYLNDGKLNITYPVDWNGTLRLWYNDEEAKKNKTVLRLEEPYVYSVRYNKHDAIYENKSFYAFTLCTFIKRALKKNIKNGITDTLWLQK